MEMQFVRLDTTLPAPTSTWRGDAGIDLYARTSTRLGALGGRASIPTGIAVAIPTGHVGLIAPRSGLALKSGITVLNSPGVIDSGYRGEVIVILVNTSASEYSVSRGDRIAQLLVQPLSSLVWTETVELPETERGTRGFGHSGR